MQKIKVFIVVPTDENLKTEHFIEYRDALVCSKTYESGAEIFEHEIDKNVFKIRTEKNAKPNHAFN